MTADCSNCSNSGELRAMIEDVADKAAKNAAASVAKDLKIEMLQMETRIEEKIVGRVELKLQEHFGMTPQEHAIEHDRMRKIYNTWAGLSTAFWKKVIVGVAVIGLGAAAGTFVEIKALPQSKPSPEKHQIERRGAEK